MNKFVESKKQMNKYNKTGTDSQVQRKNCRKGGGVGQCANRVKSIKTDK